MSEVSRRLEPRPIVRDRLAGLLGGLHRAPGAAGVLPRRGAADRLLHHLPGRHRRHRTGEPLPDPDALRAARGRRGAGGGASRRRRGAALPVRAGPRQPRRLPDLARGAHPRRPGSTGAGWGLVTVLGAYVARGQGFVRTGITSALANNLASLLAGVAVICHGVRARRLGVRHRERPRVEQRGAHLPLAAAALRGDAGRRRPAAALLPDALLRGDLLADHPARTREPDGDGPRGGPSPFGSARRRGRLRVRHPVRVLARFLPQSGLGLGGRVAALRPSSWRSP